MPSFHVLVASIDRPTLQNLITSITSQLDSIDHLTIVYDNINNPKSLDLSNAKCNIHIYNEAVNLGFWGHGVRNKYKDIIEETDFVMHADDDDIYTKGTFEFLRKQCISLDTLYIARFRFSSQGRVIPHQNRIQYCDIGTPCGIVPYKINKISKFELFMTGDYNFYNNIEKMGVKINYLDFVIYITRPNINDLTNNGILY